MRRRIFTVLGVLGLVAGLSVVAPPSASAFHYDGSSATCTGAVCDLEINTSFTGTGFSDGFVDVNISGPVGIALAAAPTVVSHNCTGSPVVTNVTTTSFTVTGMAFSEVCDITVREFLSGGDGTTVTNDISSPSSDPDGFGSDTVDASTVIDFDALGVPCHTPITTQYANLGAVFAGSATIDVFCASGSYPPHSGASMAFDDGTGMVDVNLAPNASSFGAYISSLSVVTIECFDASDVSLGSDASTGDNVVNGANPPNEFVSVNAPGIDHCRISDGTDPIVIDDVTIGYAPLVATTSSVTDVPDPDAYVCNQTGFIGFESLPDAFDLTTASPIGGVQFTTTDNQDWLVGDWTTGLYNGKFPTGGYTSAGDKWAWLGASQGAGRIDFVGGPASNVSVLVSVNDPNVVLEAYDAADTLLATAGPSSINVGTGHMDELKVVSGAADIAYVIVHDTGNFFLVDDLCTDAPDVSDPGHETSATVSGSSAIYSDGVTLSGHLVDVDAANAAIAGAALGFTLGATSLPQQSVAGSALTNASGNASGAFTQVLQTPGPAVPIGVSFAGGTIAGQTYDSDTGASTIAVGKETCTVAYSGDTLVAPGVNTVLKAQLGENDSLLGDLSGKTVTFNLTGAYGGAHAPIVSNPSNGTGEASKSVALDQDIYTVTISFAGDGYYNPCSLGTNDTLIVVQAAGAKTTGGGSYNAPDRANFGFNVIPSGAAWKGEFQLRSNNGKKDFHGSNVTNVTKPTATSVMWTTTGKWNGVAGYTAEITVVDNGSSGGKKGDTINIKIKLTASPFTVVYNTTSPVTLKTGNIDVKK